MKNFLIGVEHRILKEAHNIENYTGIEYDSRKIQRGNIFVALEGSVVDGHNYIEPVSYTHLTLPTTSRV